MGSVQCSICARGTEASDLVNEMLYRGEYLTIIAAKTGLSKSALHRHKRGKCENNFLTWKANRLIRSKRQKVAGRRTVVRWFGLEGGTKKGPERITTVEHSRFTTDSTCFDIKQSDICADDVLVNVVFDPPKPARRPPAFIVLAPPETQSQD